GEAGPVGETRGLDGGGGGVNELRDAPGRAGEGFRVREASVAKVQPNLLPEEDGSSWRQEVSERLHRYHARRRPRAPRYPSLRLKFERPETNWATPVREPSVSSQSAQPLPVSSATRPAVAMDYVEVAPSADPAAFELRASEVALPVAEPRSHEGTGKIIEFPRTMYAPPVRVHDLADPVLDRPRILEAPEVVPPPPALGGMTIEETARAEPERRPGIDMPLQSAPVRQRLMAVAIDASIVLAAAGLFGGIFYKITKAMPALPPLAPFGAGLWGIFWAAYQYLLMVHSGTTPGLRTFKLRVQRFDGKPASRRLRRWRVLSGMLSGVSLGMGYAWHFLDEDGLCWHERVTRTHIASKRG
ncbi:MAG: RDD family protein, partial [Terriglobales bacterium]